MVGDPLKAGIGKHNVVFPTDLHITTLPPHKDRGSKSVQFDKLQAEHDIVHDAFEHFLSAA